MMSFKIRAVAAAAAFCSVSAFAQAEESSREHGAHEHGTGALGVVLVGSELAFELRMPGVNVVGFEHAPESDADREAVANALAVFRAPAQLYAPNAEAQCVVVSGEASLGPEDGDDHGEHTELVAASRFECAAPQRLTQVEVKAFDHLRDVDDLDAQVITERSQGEVELSPEQTVLPLGGS